MIMILLKEKSLLLPFMQIQDITNLTLFGYRGLTSTVCVVTSDDFALLCSLIHRIGTAFAGMSSKIALTPYLGMRTVFQTKSMKIYIFGFVL